MGEEKLLANVLFSHIPRNVLRGQLEALTGRRSSLRKPEAANELAKRLFAMPAVKRLDCWLEMEPFLIKIEKLCQSLKLPVCKTALRQRLLGIHSIDERPPTQHDRHQCIVGIDTDTVELVGGGDHYLDTVIEMIRAAQREVVIVAFVARKGFSEVSAELSRAADRGVAVRLVVDGRKRHPRFWRRSVKRGEVDRRFKIDASGQVHAKAIIVDRCDVLLGSSNLDPRDSPVYQLNVRYQSAEAATIILGSLVHIQKADG